MPMPRPDDAPVAFVWRVLAVLATIGVAATLTALGPAHAGSLAPARFAVSAGTDDCGSGWRAPRAGTQAFVLKNTGVAGTEVYLQSPKTGAIYLDVESLGTGAAREESVILTAGTYRFVCLPADADPAYGPKVTVTGGGVHGATPGIRPVTRNDLIPAAKAYGAWIQGRLPVLVADVARLNADVASARLGVAKRDWLTAHAEYETLGAAYGAFGDADTAINGMPSSGRTAATDPRLTGFHKIEALLFGGTPAPSIARYTRGLLTDVTRLKTAFADVRIDPLDVGLRAHEILENALQFELTGRADAGSHTDLATVDANLTGTAHALEPLRGILAIRYPDLAKTDAAVARAQTVVREFRSADGSWRPLSALSRTDRERVDAAVDGALELLAPVAAICDVRRQP
jgi:Predicted periplasmic lipoprotein involved in iron transport